MFIFKGRS